MKFLKVISAIFIFAVVGASLIFLYIELEPYDFNPFNYSRLKGDKYMMFAPLFLFIGISSVVFSVQKFQSLKFLNRGSLKIFRFIDIIFSIILIISSLLIIFLTDVLDTNNTFAMSFFSIMILLSILNLIDGLSFKI